ncbi:MAG: DNA mismatch repair endonuclease MutL [Lachnospiraceae bacterium]|nr:DNA mismatch repair endonuclease MutL [Lachnospiraceae bacterium]
MPEINLLSQSTIDQIAAGEVVERPSSVVKELIENAIDAGAGAITVELKEGGISLIRVTDNGCGIEKDQIKKAFLRHATSKIKSIEDLNFVDSLGFRGEALSSIAAVSQVEVITKTEHDLTGIKYSIAGGVEEDMEEIGAPCGTTFLVHNLFYNTPARKKFLKQPQTEGGYVSDLMEHIALSRPDISVKFVNGGQVRFHTSGNGDLKEVIYRIYGREMAEAVIPFEAKSGLCRVFGYIGKPEINRSNRNFEIYFVNGRFVKDDIISKAIEEGYRQYVMQHKFPFAVLHFTIDPQEIDVNVHPSKMQIRIHKGNEMYSFLSGAIHEKLHEIEMIPKLLLDEEKAEKNTYAKVPEPFEAKRIANLVKEDDQPGIPPILQKSVQNRIFGQTNERTKGQNAGNHSNIIKADEHIVVEKPVQMNLFEEKILTADARNDYHILGQIFDTYWLIAYKDKLLFVDQHAAHEKVKYERLVKELQQKTVSMQMVNPPVVLSLTGKEEELLKEYMDYFEQLGFEIEEFGGGSYALRSVPSDLYGCNEKKLFTEVMDELSENPMKGAPDVILHKLASMACKSAVKGNNSMEMQEMEALIDELLALDNPYHCPHGRPTIISMSKYEIEKKFKRVVS